MRCIELAIHNPAAPGEFRVFNQITKSFSLQELAEKVTRVGAGMGLSVIANHIPNPRVESEEHYYNPVHIGLLELGLEPHLLDDATIGSLIGEAVRNHAHLNPRLILPTVDWHVAHNQVKETAAEPELA